MKQLIKLAAAAALGALASGTIVYAQAGSSEPPQGADRALPRSSGPAGRLAASGSPRRTALLAAAGVPAGKLYAHTDGDSWDYLAIDPVTTPAQDEAVDAAAKKMGMPIRPGSLARVPQICLDRTPTRSRSGR